MNRDLILKIIGSAFGLGLAPVAPGTFGALLGVALHLVCAYILQPTIAPAVLSLGFFAVFGAHVAMNDWAATFYNDPDPKNFVLDEVVGYLMVPVFFPYGSPWKVAIIGFLLFRVIDIIKVPPARKIDREMHNAWGVVLDDVIAGAYAVIVLYVAYVVLPLFGLEMILG